MKIISAYLRGFKRLSGSRIKEFIGEFPAPVQIIVGSNSSGKTSLMRELSPLPSIRTDYEHDGVKELHITHNQHLYVLKSDFTNRTSPHSFIMDDEELNTGHTSQVQEELAIQHFGFTPAIRNLVYGKTRVCSMTPATRKEMFLQLNPMDLSLVLGSYRNALSKYKDSKANVALLNTRKANLEAVMLPAAQLEEYKKRKSELEDKSLDCDKSIYGIQQQIESLKRNYSDALEYYRQCTDRGVGPIAVEDIKAQCRRITARTTTYTSIDRDTYIEDRESYLRKLAQLQQSTSELTREIDALKQEIDEYTHHLAEVSEHPQDKLEEDITALKCALENYKDLPTTYIPATEIEHYRQLETQVWNEAQVFSTLTVKMIPVAEIEQLLASSRNYQREVDTWKLRYDEAMHRYTEYNKEIDANVTRANVPTDCKSTTCGLLALFNSRYQSAQEKTKAAKEQLGHAEVKYKEAVRLYDEVATKLQPYLAIDAINHYHTLQSIFSQPYITLREGEDLVSLINRDPLLLGKRIADTIAVSLRCIERDKLTDQLTTIQAELAIVKKSNSAMSIAFLQKHLDTKMVQYKTRFKEYQDVCRESRVVEETLDLYAEYAKTKQEVEALNTQFTLGSTAVLVHATLEFWHTIISELESKKKTYQEELRRIDGIIQDQEVTRRTYTSETITLLNDIQSKMDTYSKVATALSPTTGIIHNSMVRYLNAMIDNVNYFIEQLWNFRLKLKYLDLDDTLSYQFPIEIDMESAPDINKLSDGQTEIVDFTWSLAILLQLQMLHQIPLYADELGRACDLTHRNKILLFLNSLVDNSLVEQVFLINHYAALQEGFTNADVICLNSENLGELPSDTNAHIQLVRA